MRKSAERPWRRPTRTTQLTKPNQAPKPKASVDTEFAMMIDEEVGDDGQRQNAMTTIHIEADGRSGGPASDRIGGGLLSRIRSAHPSRQQLSEIEAEY